MKRELIQLKKEISQYFKKRAIKRCFYPEHSECSSKVINAHSIQNNKCLSLLTERVDNNEGLYSFSKYSFLEDGRLQLELTGRKAASTFSGFCTFHDQTLFKDIDNNDFDYSSKQMFLYSYRAFAQAYHKKMEELKGQHGDSILKQKAEQDIWEDTTLGCEVSYRDLRKHYYSINKMLREQDYNQLDFYVYKKKGLYPIAASGCLIPAFSPQGEPNNSFFDLTKDCYPLIMTVLPGSSNTYVIFAYYRNDTFSQGLINELRFRFWDNLWIEKVISSFLVFDMENTCISPYIWESMNYIEQEQLYYELLQSIIPSINPTYFNAFNFSAINFFDPKYLKTT